MSAGNAPADPAGLASGTAPQNRDAASDTGDAVRRLRALLENLTESITVLDRAGRVAYSTGTLQPSLGYAPETIVGRDAADVVHPADRERAAALVRDVLAVEGTMRRGRFRVASAAGEWRVLECTAVNRLEEPDVAGVIITARDVTDELAAGAELERRDEELRLVLDQLPCVLWTTDAQLRITSMRGRVTDDLSPLVGRPLDEVLRAEPGGHEMLAAHRGALAGRASSYLVHIQGRPFEANVAPLHDGDGVSGVVGLALDISRHMKAEEALRVQREVQEQILDQLPLMLSLLDAEGRFEWVNRAWRTISGWTLEDARAPDFAERAVVDGAARAAIPQHVGSPVAEWYDVRIRTRAGQLITVSWNDVRLPDGRYLGIGRDVTEARRSSQQLRESEERYRLMIERSDQVFFYTHDRDGLFEYISPSSEAAIGYAPDELVGKPYSFLTPAESTPEVKEKTEGALATGVRAAPYEVVVRHKLGHLLRMEVTESPVIREGRVVGMQGFARDVTQLRRLEEQVQHAQKMEAVGRLAGGVAHDFNNILTVIDGNADAGLVEPSLPRPVHDCLTEIKLASERGARLTRQLLAFSRKQVVQRTVLDLNESVRHMHAMLQRLIGDHVVLRLELDTLPAWILADAGQIEQVLLNLAVNARDAMPRGGELCIRTRHVRPGDTERAAPGEWVLLEVEDDGEGIEAAVLPHIFEPFFNTRDRGKGTGLGLATTYAIAESNGGWIEVASERGCGARFRVFLPCTEPAEAEAVPVPEHGAAGGGETILLAEDDPAVRGVVRQMLHRLGYTLHEAEHGGQALQLLREVPGIRLLLSDLMMPVMGGIELAEQVRMLHPDLPVLFISGYTDDAPGLHTNGAPLLHKPFTARQLAGAVRSLLDGARPTLD